jgi:hypothetical protein
VYAFLILAIIGLDYFVPENCKSKTNAFLQSNDVGFYGILTSFVNWGAIITYYNIEVNKC